MSEMRSVADEDVLGLATLVERELGHQALGEAKRLLGQGPAFRLGVVDGDRLLGAVVGHPSIGDGAWTAELVVETMGEDGTESDLIGGAEAEALRSEAEWLRFWTLGDRHGQALLDAGYHRERVLHRMVKPLPPLGRPHYPSEFHVEGFRPEVDVGEWLRVNNSAFSGHPENGRWTQANLEDRFAQPWFEPHLIRMLWEAETLVGSCWTKPHPGAVGEIYIIGIHPDYQGRGLGRQLTLSGLWHLSEKLGCETAMLFADEANVAGTQLYANMGFHVDRDDVSYVRDLS